MPIKLKDAFKETVVGFNNSALPLGQRNDLHLLLNDVIADDGSIRNTYIASMFEELPTKQELIDIKTQNSLEKAKKLQARK